LGFRIPPGAPHMTITWAGHESNFQSLEAAWPLPIQATSGSFVPILEVN
jgi:hypothetical protein